ncbi:MAG: aminotransferase class IV [Cyanobacteria bacterium]|nr:aminotransferase class IV [Cyanobacteriota bacterium]
MIPLNPHNTAPQDFDTELFTTLLYPCPDWWLDVHCRRLLQHVKTLAPNLSLDNNVEVSTLRTDVKQSLESLSSDCLPTVVRLEAGLCKTRPEAGTASAAFSLQLRPVPHALKAAVLCLTPYEKPSPHLKIKTLNSYNILAETVSVRDAIQRQGYQKDGYPDALWSNSQGLITETTTANFFIFRNTDDDRIQILTPPTSLCLAGTVRSWLLNVLEALNAEAPHIDVHETPLTWETLSHDHQAFSGAFLTNAVHGIIPVLSIFNPDANIPEAKQSLSFSQDAFCKIHHRLRHHWRSAGLRFAVDYSQENAAK